MKQKILREEAITHFKRALEIYPKFFNVSFDLGRTYALLNEADSSLRYFHLALTLDSTYSEIPINIGEIYFFQQKYAEAQALCEKALELRRERLGEKHPLTASSYNSLACILDEQGKYAEAQPFFQKAPVAV